MINHCQWRAANQRRNYQLGHYPQFALKIKIGIIAACLFVLPFLPGFAHPADTAAGIPALTTAEYFFKAMKSRDYQAIWNLLTNKSRETIINDVHQAMRREGDISPDYLREDFVKGGPYARAYWDAYLGVFDPDSVLEQSAWSLGAIRKNRAEIKILHRKSQHPAILQLYFEDNTWKVGLEETFRPRRWLR